MQSVIKRMADNSRACKTWAVTLVAAILVVVARFGLMDGRPALGPEVALIALLPAFLFWLLDSYYLALERAFRESYNGFVERLHSNMVCPAEVFDISLKSTVKLETLKCTCRFAIAPFYLILVAVIVAFWLIVCWADV